MESSFKIVSLLTFFTALSGCGVLIGNVKPVDEKSENFSILELSKDNPDWIKIDSGTSPDKDDLSEDTTDLTFQSQSTASIVSINSACRAKNLSDSKNLRVFTDQLLLSVTEITLREEKELQINGHPALETTLIGKVDSETMKLRTVVLRSGSCLYDLMYIARPPVFPIKEPDFSRFVSSLRLE